MTLVQTNICKIRDKSALCAQKFSLKILLQVNLRLRACLAMCLKYRRFQPERAYNARACIKKKSVIELMNYWTHQWIPVWTIVESVQFSDETHNYDVKNPTEVTKNLK